MQAEIYEQRDDMTVVDVVDNSGSRHLVDVEQNGSIGTHRTDDYPHDPEARSEEDMRIFRQVQNRAKYEAHQLPDYDTVSPAWDPEEIPRAIEALENIDREVFVNKFEDFYNILVDPSSAKDARNIRGRLDYVTKAFCYTDQPEVVHVNPDVLLYYTVNGETKSTGRATECPPDAKSMTLVMPPIEDFNRDFGFPEDFRDLCVNNLICQIRDIYLSMGEEPPAEVDKEGFGKLTEYGMKRY